MSGDEPAERLAHEVACELGYATPDGLQASFLSGHDTHTLHYKVNVRYKKSWEIKNYSSSLNKKHD